MRRRVAWRDELQYVDTEVSLASVSVSVFVSVSGWFQKQAASFATAAAPLP